MESLPSFSVQFVIYRAHACTIFRLFRYDLCEVKTQILVYLPFWNFFWEISPVGGYFWEDYSIFLEPYFGFGSLSYGFRLDGFGFTEFLWMLLGSRTMHFATFFFLLILYYLISLHAVSNGKLHTNFPFLFLILGFFIFLSFFCLLFLCTDIPITLVFSIFLRWCTPGFPILVRLIRYQ